MDKPKKINKSEKDKNNKIFRSIMSFLLAIFFIFLGILIISLIIFYVF